MLSILETHGDESTDTCVEKSLASVIIKGLEPYHIDRSYGSASNVT